MILAALKKKMTSSTRNLMLIIFLAVVSVSVSHAAVVSENLINGLHPIDDLDAGVIYAPSSLSAVNIAQNPVYRFYSSNYKSHFYTKSTTEKDSIIANDSNWTYEGIAFYVSVLTAPPIVPPVVPPNTPIDGICGSSNAGSFDNPPITNLCYSPGLSTVVMENTVEGEWRWSCPGQNGGSPVTCSAESTSYITACDHLPTISLNDWSAVGSAAPRSSIMGSFSLDSDGIPIDNNQEVAQLDMEVGENISVNDQFLLPDSPRCVRVCYNARMKEGFDTIETGKLPLGYMPTASGTGYGGIRSDGTNGWSVRVGYETAASSYSTAPGSRLCATVFLYISHRSSSKLWGSV